MAMTAMVKDELSRLEVTKPCCRKAEVSTMLRFAGGLHIIGGQIVVEAELDTANAARRLRRNIAEVYGHRSDVLVLAAGGLRRGSRYVVRVVEDGATLARQTGLIDARGRPVRGPAAQGRQRRDLRLRGRVARRLPRPRLAHRAGPLVRARGHLPGPEAALALVGAARRLGIQAKAREVRGVDRVVIRDGDAIGAMLTRLGRARRGPGLGGAPHAPRGPRHGQPPGQLRRRQPAPLRARGGRRRGPGRAGHGDPRRRRPRPPARGRARSGSSTSRRASRSSASSPTRR